MSTEQENASILRQAYQAWDDSKAADIGCWLSIISDDARLTSLADGAPEMPFTRRRSGRSEIIDYLEGLRNDWEMIYYRITEYVAEGDRVVAVGVTSWKNKLTGKIATSPKVDLWRFRNGKVVEFSEFYDTAQIYAAAHPG
jgi:ketosteroid isomerase-like protein